MFVFIFGPLDRKLVKNTMAPNFSKITSRTDVKIAVAASAALGAWIIRNSLKSRWEVIFHSNIDGLVIMKSYDSRSIWLEIGNFRYKINTKSARVWKLLQAGSDIVQGLCLSTDQNNKTIWMKTANMYLHKFYCAVYSGKHRNYTPVETSVKFRVFSLTEIFFSW